MFKLQTSKELRRSTFDEYVDFSRKICYDSSLWRLPQRPAGALMATTRSRVLVLRFTLPRSVRPVDVIDWIAQMLATHSGTKVSIEPSRPQDDRPVFAVISTVELEEDADRVRSAWRDNQDDWRDTGAELCH
jgi:hypothetical protein